NRHLSNCELSKVIARMWKEEKEDVKTHYQMLAERGRKEHKERYPDYRYRPRKEGEIVRRPGRKGKAKSGSVSSLSNSESPVPDDVDSPLSAGHIKLEYELPISTAPTSRGTSWLDELLTTPATPHSSSWDSFISPEKTSFESLYGEGDMDAMGEVDDGSDELFLAEYGG
ncbi:hypothetical protein HK104_008095, partial [Borealophlyctis nickersoniae]